MAKFVLRSFRPDGADSRDRDFAEALQLATEDRELGQWLVRERAFDAEFAEALARVTLPPGLRESVLLSMVRDGGGFPQADSGGDEEMFAAMGHIKVPRGLRGSILEAMDRSAMVERKKSGWRRLGVPIAAAAGIALAFIFSNGKPAAETARSGRITVDAVQAGFVKTIESPIFSLEREDEHAPKLMSYLRSKGLPCGRDYLPPGLEGMKGLGCRELVIDGKRGSMLCFDTDGGAVHLIIFRKKDIDCDLPDMKSPLIGDCGNWAEARWVNGDFVFVLLGVREKESLKSFF